VTTLAGPFGNAPQQAGEPPRNRAVDALGAIEPERPVDLDKVDPLTREMAAAELARTIRSEGRYLTLAERAVMAAALMPEFHMYPGGVVGDLP
jgi:hypothetical protein